MNKKKIFFVLPDLVPGGAERVMSFIAQNISKEYFDTSLWLAGYERSDGYSIESIKVTYFNKPRVLKAIPRLFNALRKEKPDLIISSMAHVNSALAMLSIFFPKTKFVGREANVLSVVGQYKKGSGLFGGSKLIKFSYKLLDMLICQSNDMLTDMKTNYGISEKKLKKINNPITDSFKVKQEKTNKGSIIKFVTVARLKKQKGHLRIVKALSKLDFPFEYTIVGDGPEKNEIFNLINECNLNEKIKHIPFTKEVSKHLSESDLFLQGSYVEGFPNCLIESCSVGTPIVAFNAPGGLNEIIEEGVNGFIAENENDYISLIDKAVTSHKWSPKEINESVHKKFNKEKILKEYENLFLEILNN